MSQTIFPARRLLPPDIATPNFGDLVDLALLRVCDAASPLEPPPPRLFPTAETMLGNYYTYNDWLTHGNLETELGRMSYTLSKLPERGIPTACIATVHLILSSPQVLTAWKRTLPQLKKQAVEVMHGVIYQMQKKERLNTLCDKKSGFYSIPVDYKTDTAASGYAIQLWGRSLSEIVVHAAKGQFDHVKEFLQIFAFLKDPLGGLENFFDKAADLFVDMMSSVASLARKTSDNPLTGATWHCAAAQAAQEALFLASPLLQNIDYIHFTGHQQLPYIYVELDELPRSEFSISEHVLHIVEEILTSEPSQNNGSCLIAPIAISSYPALSMEQGKCMTVIIDGNHRATATMILRLVAEHPIALTTDEPREVLCTFCTDHGLSHRWKIDLAEVIETLRGSRYVALIQGKMDLVERFREVKTIPALVVQEDNFHTVCKQRPAFEDRPRLLLPIHQALYNDDNLGFTFPSAGQVHGRALGFKPMPLIRPESEGGKGSECNDR